MGITIEEARRVARLARLGLPDDVLRALACDLDRVLDHFETIEECASTATGSGASATRPVDRPPALRADEPGDTLTQRDALANAPAAESGQFSVPGFLPDEP